MNIKNPLEISCAEAKELANLQAAGESSYMEDSLLRAHLKKCAVCAQDFSQTSTQ